VAYLHDERGNIEKARELAQRVLAIYARTPTKPEHLATAIEFAGQLEYKLGDIASALAASRKALAIREQALGPSHFYVAMSLETIGIYLVDLGKPAEALEAFDRAYAINLAALRPNHPRIAGPLVNAAKPLASLRRFAEARERVGRAMTILEQAHQLEHPHAVVARTALAEVYRREGHFEEALAEAQRADAIQEKLAPDAIERSLPLAAIGQAQLALRRREDAVATLTRALALMGRAGLRSPDVGEVQFALARAIGDTNRERARALAIEARGLDALERKAIDAWLARHR
jgi:serine/threonine-protein kinase